MDKLREGIVKMFNSKPNVSSPESLNLILQQHFERFMSDLQTSPDHPPYAWVIQFYDKVCVLDVYI